MTILLYALAAIGAVVVLVTVFLVLLVSFALYLARRETRRKAVDALIKET